MNPSEKTFETGDSFLAAFLLAKNRTIVAIRTDAKRKWGAIFVFDDPDQKIGSPSGLQHEYFADGLVSARTLGRHLDRLRRCVREQTECGNAFDRQALANLFPTERREKAKKKKALRGLRLLELRVLLFLCTPLFGDDRAARLAWSSGIIGRPVSSFRELLAFEAEQLIDLLLKAARKEQTGGRRPESSASILTSKASDERGH